MVLLLEPANRAMGPGRFSCGPETSVRYKINGPEHEACFVQAKNHHMMNQDLQHCTREQAIRLAELKLFKQPVESEEWQPGDLYSVFIHEQERKFMLGYQEDSPHQMYKPIRLMSCAELGESFNHVMKLPEKMSNGKWFASATKLQYMTEAEARAAQLIEYGS